MGLRNPREAAPGPRGVTPGCPERLRFRHLGGPNAKRVMFSGPRRPICGRGRFLALPFADAPTGRRAAGRLRGLHRRTCRRAGRRPDPAQRRPARHARRRRRPSACSTSTASCASPPTPSIIATDVFIGPDALVRRLYDRGNDCVNGHSLTINASGGVAISPAIDLRGKTGDEPRRAARSSIRAARVSLGGGVETSGTAAPSGGISIDSPGLVVTQTLHAPGAGISVHGGARRADRRRRLERRQRAANRPGRRQSTSHRRAAT